MKVLINISVISKNHRGMGVFAKQIIRELIKNNHHQYIFISGNDIDKQMDDLIKSTHHIYRQINAPLPIFEQLVAPYLINKFKPDICWFPSNTFPLIMSSKIKYIATICDLIFLKNEIKPQSLYQKIGKYYRTINILLGTKKLDKVTSISYTVIHEIYDKFQLNEKIDETQVLYVAQQFSFNEDGSIFKKLNIKSSDKYFYSIAGIAPHKNLDFLIEAFNFFQEKNKNIKLIISGATHSKYNGLDENIVFTPFISEEEKKSLIKNAEIFIFPSLIEGFGIPLIEGLYHNPHVLVSDIAIFREIGKEYVSYFDPYDKEFLVKYFETPRKDINHEEAREYILTTFNAIKSTRKLENIFNEFK